MFLYCGMIQAQDKFCSALIPVSGLLSVCQDIWFITFERTKMKKRSRAHRVVDHHPSVGQPKQVAANHLFWSPNQRAKYIPILVFLSAAFDFQVNSLYPSVCGREAAAQGERQTSRRILYRKQSRTTNTTAVLTTRTLCNSKACAGGK